MDAETAGMEGSHSIVAHSIVDHSIVAHSIVTLAERFPSNLELAVGGFSYRRPVFMYTIDHRATSSMTESSVADFDSDSNTTVDGGLSRQRTRS
jgi:hypothetical protein